MFKKLLFSFCLIIQSSSIFSQGGNVSSESILAPVIGATYNFQVPGGDLSSRFGVNSAVGVMTDFKLKSQWILGAEYNFMFGNQLRETSILDNLLTSQDFVITQAGQNGQILLGERGHQILFNVGRLFPVIGPNKNSGLVFKFGVGYLQHKIHIEFNSDQIPQLTGDYMKGYDRLTSGLMLNQFFGYQNLSNSKLTNFFAGIQISEGFTKSRRSFNFDTMEADTQKRLDLLYSVRVGWILPVYKRAPKNYIPD